jgi:uncharacterized Tic20 family protein
MSYEDVPAGGGFSEHLPTVLSSEEKTWGMLCHLSTLLSYLAFALTFIGPLVCWLVKKDSSKFVDYHGKESLNFQLNILIYSVIGIALIPCFLIGAFLLPVVHLYNVVCVIIAGIKASGGELFRYPFVFRFIK